MPTSSAVHRQRPHEGALGKLDLAESTYAQAVQVTNAETDAHGFGWLLLHHSRVQRAHGDIPAAMREAREGLRLMVEAGDPRGVFIANLRLAEVLLADGDSPGAATLLRDLLSTSLCPRNTSEAGNDTVRAPYPMGPV
jgi:hypothetical protein